MRKEEVTRNSDRETRFEDLRVDACVHSGTTVARPTQRIDAAEKWAPRAGDPRPYLQLALDATSFTGLYPVEDAILPKMHSALAP